MATGWAVGQVTVFSGAQRRRRWSLDEKLALVEAPMPPGASIADVARVIATISDHSQTRLHELLPWNWKARQASLQPDAQAA